MDSLKSFFDNLRDGFVKSNWDNRDLNEFQEQLGMFYWNRGGKRFAKEKFDSYKFYLKNKNRKGYLLYWKTFWDCVTDKTFPAFYRHDFDDALDCLGEEKVKELIKELGA